MQTPKAPDPVKTAQAQAGYNQDTATTQQLLNMTNQVTPDGSLTYDQTGTNTYVGADGKTHTVPQYTATQTLSDAGQKLYDTNQQTQQGLADVANQQTGKIGSLLNTNVDLSNEATEARLMELGSKRLDPRFAQEQEDLRTRLANQGIREGSAAYDAALGNFNQSKNDAYNQLLLNGRGQAVQEALTERNQPINEISALMSGSQVSQPNFTSTPQTNVAGVDYTGLVNNQYNQQVSQSNAGMGGLFGALGAGMNMFKFAPIALSDRRYKTDIERIGTHPSGIGLYAWRYLMGALRHVGVMADEAKALPGVVRTISGVDFVNYAALEA